MFMRKTILDNLLKIPFDANNNYEHLSIDKVHMFINPSYQFNLIDISCFSITSKSIIQLLAGSLQSL